MPQEMVPAQDHGLCMVRLQTAVGSSLDETDAYVRRTEQFLLSRPDVARIFGSVGGFGGGVNSAMLFVTMTPKGERETSQADLMAIVRKELNSYPGLRASLQDPSLAGFSARRGYPIEISVQGSDWDALVAGSRQLMDRMRASGLVVDLDTDYQLGMPELEVHPDRARAADLGVSVEEVATTLNALVGGVRVGKYSSAGRRYDVRLRLLAGQRSSPEDLTRLRVRTASGDLVPLSLLVRTEERPALQAITRRDRERAITVFGNPAPGVAQAAVLARIAEMARSLPPGVRALPTGASATLGESFSSLFFALWLGIVVAYMVLASQFNSFLHPVTVLTILPIAVAGAAFALAAAGHTLNIYSLIGLLLLIGIVKKNSILLVDFINQMRARGHDTWEAILRAGPIRLRPILMTSVATMMAAVPVALGLGAGSETRQPMAIAVLGGLIVSTALSLLVVPAFYLLADRWKVALAQRFRKPAAAGAAPEPAPTTDPSA